MSTSTEIDRVIKGFYCTTNILLCNVVTPPYPNLNGDLTKACTKQQLNTNHISEETLREKINDQPINNKNSCGSFY